MENKYFTPAIEDIRVGYECEVFISSFLEGFIWEKQIIDKARLKAYASIPEQNIKYTRVPYLTKEQIEADGWVPDDFQFKKEIDTDSYYSLTLSGNDVTITKVYIDGWSWVWKPFYSGECKDINTLRYIMKLLNIK